MAASDPYKPLMEQLGYPESARMRAVLENLMTPEQARMVAALPGTPEEVAKKTGVDVDRVRGELDGLFFKGVVFPKGDFERREFFRFARSVGQLHDATQATRERDVEKDREFYRLWHDFVTNEWYPNVGKLASKLTQPRARVVPAYKAIQHLPDVLPFEDYRELLKAQEKIAVVPCSCRYRTTSVGEHCGVTAEEEKWHCLQFGRGAEYVEKRGSGKVLSIEEALELLDEIEEDGLLHIWPNSAKMTGVNTSCQCCRDCCMTYVPMDMVGESIGKVWEKSRYEAAVDQQKCAGCQTCVDRCPFDAIDMVRPADVAGARKSKKLKARVTPEQCWGCGVCVVGCEYGALSLHQVRPPEHIPAVS